jgi:ComF family protein
VNTGSNLTRRSDENPDMPKQRLAPMLWQAALDLLLPLRCPACDVVDRSQPGRLGFCELCWHSVEPVFEPCQRCGVPEATPLCGRCREALPGFDSARAPLLYGGQLAVAIQRAKYNDQSQLCSVLGRSLRRVLAGGLAERVDLALPVPLHRRQLTRRGFNQAALLCRSAVKSTMLRARYDLLLRCRETPRQAGSSLARRRENVAGAFSVDPRGRSSIAGRRVLLVDDVLTTGATAAACTRALYDAGAAEVHVLTLARAVP